MIDGTDSGLNTRVQTELLEQVLNMHFYSTFGDIEPAGDLNC